LERSPNDFQNHHGVTSCWIFNYKISDRREYFSGLMQVWIFLFLFRSCAISIINERGYLFCRVSEGKIFGYIEGID